MKTNRMSPQAYWNRLSIKYKIVLISASLISLRIILNGNYFLGYQQLEKYHEFEHHVHFASTKLYTFKSTFTEIFFTNGALPQIEQSQRLLEDIVKTFTSLHTLHAEGMIFHSRITQLEMRAEQLQITVEQVMQTPQKLSFSDPDAMITLGRVTALTNSLFVDVHRLIEDVTVYSAQMRDETFKSMITMGMVIFSVGILFLIMLYRGVMGPLKLLEEMRNLIRHVRTQGDLSTKLKGESDTEVGRLAHDFNELIASLDENLGKTSHTVLLVAEHVERLSHEVRESHEEISHQQHEIFHLSNAIRMMAETLQTLAENAHSVSLSVSELEQHSREGQKLQQHIESIHHALSDHIAGAQRQIKTIREVCLIHGKPEAQPGEMPDTTDKESGSFGNTISRLQYYSQEAANSIEYATVKLGEQHAIQDNVERAALLIHQLTNSIDRCTQKILATIETEKDVLQTINREIDEIASIESQAAFTSNLITSASDELLYLSKLLSTEVKRFHTSQSGEDEPLRALQSS